MRDDKRLDSLEARLLATATPAWTVRLAAQGAFADAVREQVAGRLVRELDTPERVAQYATAQAQWQAVSGRQQAAGERYGWFDDTDWRAAPAAGSAECSLAATVRERAFCTPPAWS